MAEPAKATMDQRKRRDVLQKGGTDKHRKTENHHSPPSPNPDTQTDLAVPFRGHIRGGMQLGKKIIIVGVVASRPDRFYIGLSCGCGTSREPPFDVALELGVRFRDRQVLRRARVSGTWGEIERAVPFFPFIRDQPFREPNQWTYRGENGIEHLVSVWQLNQWTYRGENGIKHLASVWIEISCERSRFRVLVDGQQLFDFSHRVTSLKDIDTLWINGSVSVTKLG